MVAVSVAYDPTLGLQAIKPPGSRAPALTSPPRLATSTKYPVRWDRPSPPDCSIYTLFQNPRSHWRCALHRTVTCRTFPIWRRLRGMEYVVGARTCLDTYFNPVRLARHDLFGLQVVNIENQSGGRGMLQPSNGRSWKKKTVLWTILGPRVRHRFAFSKIQLKSATVASSNDACPNEI